MAMLPEEFPMVMTVFLAMGAARLSKARVLTRRASAIETLGAASVLCSDKTGTMTQNRMALAQLELADGRFMAADTPLPPAFAALAQAGSLACPALSLDPMELAFLRASPQSGGKMLCAYPFSHALLAMTQVWRKGKASRAYAKGAPEAIAALCHLPKGALDSAVQAMAAQGLRVLAVAVAVAPARLPPAQTGFDFAYLGLVGLIDPLRASVPQAVATAQGAGIRVVMITGDHPATARAIATQAGLGAGDVVTGDMLEDLSPAKLRKLVQTAPVFARITPDQKLRIVQALKAGGEVVAMTGDGVNDAPSLKAAHIGIAMGGRGTDVAREAAQIVLLDDDFGSIVTTIVLGRRIYVNLRKAMGFIMAVHVPIAGLALLPLAMAAPLLFGPLHIALLEMIIDPVCALVFEAEDAEAGLMQAKPRPAAENLLTKSIGLSSLGDGAVTLAVVAGVYLAAPSFGLDSDQQRALVFLSLVAGVVALIFVNRTGARGVLAAFARPNATLGWVLGVLGAILTLAMALPQARALLGFALPPAAFFAVPLGVFALLLAALQLLKPRKF